MLGKGDKMKRTSIALIGFLATVNAFTTMQYPDKFSYESKEYQTRTEDYYFPRLFMEPYFEQHPEKRGPEKWVHTINCGGSDYFLIVLVGFTDIEGVLEVLTSGSRRA
jgi:hypothetical protein